MVVDAAALGVWACGEDAPNSAGTVRLGERAEWKSWDLFSEDAFRRQTHASWFCWTMSKKTPDEYLYV